MKTLTISILIIISLNSEAQVKLNSNNFNSFPKIKNTATIIKIPTEYQQTKRLYDPDKGKVLSNEIKSATSEKQQLDSVIYKTYNNNYFGPFGVVTGEEKKVVEYDSFGRETANTLFNWNDETNKWENLIRVEFIHNTNGKVINETHFEWNGNDSIWSNKEKFEYNYDTNGNLILDANYIWISTSESWRGTEKNIYSFDSYGNKILDALYEWDISADNWKGKEKYEYTFDESGNKTMEAYFIWDYVNVNSNTFGWSNQYVYESTYNDHNQLILYTKSQWSRDSTVLHKQTRKEIEYNSNDSISQSISYNWIELDNIWEETGKEEYIYASDSTVYNNYVYDNNLDSLIKSDVEITNFDANGDVVSKTSYYLSSQLDSIVPDKKVEYTYHSPDNLVFETVIFNYDIDSESWLPSKKIENTTYDVNGNPTQIIESSNWDQATKMWLDGVKLNYEYNSRNMMTLFETSTWDVNLDDWVGATKNEYYYDGNSNLISTAKYVWDSSINDWKGEFMEDNIFDYSYDTFELVLPYWIAQKNYQNMITRNIKYAWDDYEQAFYENYITFYYYSSTIIDNINEQTLNNIIIYPNPTKEYIKVSNITQPSRLELYSVNGNKIKTIQVMVNSPVSVAFLSPGTYIYKLFLGEKVQNGKLIKK